MAKSGKYPPKWKQDMLRDYSLYGEIAHIEYLDVWSRDCIKILKNFSKTPVTDFLDEIGCQLVGLTDTLSDVCDIIESKRMLKNGELKGISEGLRSLNRALILISELLEKD